MKPEIKAQWLTALRSGDYQQGQGYLRQGDQYCCLGVLCDLYGKAVGPEWEAVDEYYYSYDVRAMCGSHTRLPFRVQEWAGIASPNPMDLAAMNDNGSTFQELANIIGEGL